MLPNPLPSMFRFTLTILMISLLHTRNARNSRVELPQNTATKTESHTALCLDEKRRAVVYYMRYDTE